MKHLKENKGFTLVELLVAMGIFAIVTTFLHKGYQNYSRHHTAQEIEVEMQQNARLLLEFMGREIKNGVVINAISADTLSFYTSYNENARIIGVSTGENSPNTLNDTFKNWGLNDWAGEDVAIVSGTGAGQVRKVTSNNATSLTLDANWTTMPDDSSVYHMPVTYKEFAYDAVKDKILYTNGASTQTFAENIIGLTFQGYNAAGLVTANVDDIRGIDTIITVTTDRAVPTNWQNKTYTVNSYVALPK